MRIRHKSSTYAEVKIDFKTKSNVLIDGGRLERTRMRCKFHSGSDMESDTKAAITRVLSSTKEVGD